MYKHLHPSAQKCMHTHCTHEYRPTEKNKQQDTKKHEEKDQG